MLFEQHKLTSVVDGTEQIPVEVSQTHVQVLKPTDE